MKNYKKGIFVFSWIAVILWMALIFNLSAQPAAESDGLSKRVTEVIVEAVSRVVSVSTDISQISNMAEDLHHWVRKYAHFFVYFILAMLLMNALRKSKLSKTQLFLLVLGSCIFYAIMDEWHQSFVPGRSAQLSDVFIDSIGAVLGIGLYNLLTFMLLRFTSTND